MTASNNHSAAADKSAATESSTVERWSYHGDGDGRGRGDHFGVELLEQSATVRIHPPTENGRVVFGIVVGDDSGNGDPRLSTVMELDPDQAEALARDLLNTAGGAREVAADEE
jgi:hypothetical protein